MKTAVKRLIRDEKGQTLILTLILIIVGGLIMTPLLAYMSTGLIAGEVYERRMAELYAADAGVEDACWQLKQLDPDLDKVPTTPEQPPLAYSLGSLNDKEIEVTIDMISGTEGCGIYKVTSTATSAGGSNTTIESYVQNMPLFWNNAITSTGEIRLESDSEVYGDVMGNITVDKGTVTGNISGPYDPNKWPFSVNFTDFYWPLAENATLPHECCGSKCTLDVAVNSSFGPGFHDGNEGDLTIKSTADNITATLTGTVYIKGDDATLDIGDGGRPFYLDLNYQTIYVEGKNYDLSQPNKNALYIPPGKVTIIGSGAIIAEGNIDFQPNMETGSEDEFVFVLSLYGRINFQPNGTLYGSVAARDVELGPGNVLTHTQPTTNPDTGEYVTSFPTDAVESAVKILTWEVS